MLKPTFLIFSFATLVFLQACSDPEIKVVPPPSTPPPVTPPPQPLPTVACKPNLKNGYTDKVSYFIEEKVKAYLTADQPLELCRLDIYDIKGNLAFSVSSSLSNQQIVSTLPSTDGFGFLPTIEFDLPSNTVSGMYQIENKIPFIVKTREPVDVMILYPSNTVNAYCESGGKGFYSVTDKPAKISFHRPMGLQSFSTQCLSWFTTLKDIKVGYVADIDMEDYTNISNAKILAVIGHNEYWTRQARLTFDKFVDDGKDALVLSGNTMWWQVRYSDDKSQLIGYRSEQLDPESNPLLKTINWDNSLLQYPILSSIGADFPHGGFGVRYNPDKGWDGYKIVSPNSPLLEGLNLKMDDIISCPTTEYDGAPISSFDTNNHPVIDNSILNMAKVELIGFDRGYRVTATTSTFMVFQRSLTSGIIVNTASTDWCSDRGMGGTSGDAIKKITHNAITKLLKKESVFTTVF